jgi:hypothetical protein
MLKQEIEDGDVTLADPAFPRRCAARLSKPARARSRRAGSTTGAARNCSRRSRAPEYYPTRTETGLLEKHARGRALVGRAARWSSSARARRPRRRSCCGASSPPPMCRSIFRAISCANRRPALAAGLSGAAGLPVEANSMRPVALPPQIATTAQARLLPRLDDRQHDPAQRVDLLRAMIGTLGEGAMLLIGMDRVKDVEILVPPMTMPPASPRRSTSTCSTGSTASWTARCRSMRSATARSGTTIARGSRCTSKRRATMSFTVEGAPSRCAAARRSTPRTATNMAARAPHPARAGGWTPIANGPTRPDHVLAGPRRSPGAGVRLIGGGSRWARASRKVSAQAGFIRAAVRRLPGTRRGRARRGSPSQLARAVEKEQDQTPPMPTSARPDRADRGRRHGPGRLIIEAATEREEIKRAIFAEVGKVLGAQAILATNTSSIPITRLAQASPDPARFMGVHFFNPVPVMGLIELIRGLATSDATVAAVEALRQRSASGRPCATTRPASSSTAC